MYWPNNQLKTREFFKRGKFVGIWKKYYENGQLADTCIHENVKEGESDFLSYYPDGQKMRETVYTESGISTSKEWYKTGVLQSVSNKKDGKLHGLSETYYKNGSLERQNYDDGALICAEVYSPRGFLLKRDHYQKVDESVSIQGFQRHGLYEEYDLDGELKIKCSYRNGVLDGVFKEYDYRGRVIKEVLYKEGIPVENKKITYAKDERVKKILAEMMDLSRS